MSQTEGVTELLLYRQNEVRLLGKSLMETSKLTWWDNYRGIEGGGFQCTTLTIWQHYLVLWLSWTTANKSMCGAEGSFKDFTFCPTVYTECRDVQQMFEGWCWKMWKDMLCQWDGPKTAQSQQSLRIAGVYSGVIILANRKTRHWNLQYHNWSGSSLKEQLTQKLIMSHVSFLDVTHTELQYNKLIVIANTNIWRSEFLRVEK